MIITGDCLIEMRKMADNSISCIVTDPPYGLHFMGKDWDKFSTDKVNPKRTYKEIYKTDFIDGIPVQRSKPELVTRDGGCRFAGTYDDMRNDEFQEFIYHFGREALRIVKPGGHILMFGAPRRYHRQVSGLEDAGFEIRDCLMWVYGSGFPKSHNRFGLEGFGTALKPAYEPIIMAMKPCDGTFAKNAEKWGQAGINIDGCRIPTNGEKIVCDRDCSGKHEGWDRPWMKDKYKVTQTRDKAIEKANQIGRWPANVLFDEEASQLLGEPSRFFYCAKTSSKERNEGLEEMPDKMMDVDGSGRNQAGFNSDDRKPMLPRKNNHPTVKPLQLMQYLIKLVMPPKDGILLDPFAGSGSTIVAAKQLGFDAIGIEKEQEYAEIARARIAKATAHIEKDKIQQMTMGF